MLNPPIASTIHGRSAQLVSGGRAEGHELSLREGALNHQTLKDIAIVHVGVGDNNDSLPDAARRAVIQPSLVLAE